MNMPLQLIQADPVPICGLAELLRMLPSKLTDLIRQVHQGDDAANCYMQMFYVGMALDEISFAADMQASALALRTHYRIRGPANPRLRLLAIMGPGSMLDNTPVDLLIHGTDIQLDLLFIVSDFETPTHVPLHDIAIIAIGEGDKNIELLQQMETLSIKWPRPILNQPSRILNCSRDVSYRLLKGISGLVVPRTLRYRSRYGVDFDFPLIIRPVDTHGGNGMVRVSDSAALAQYLVDMPADDYYLIEYIDYKSSDGQYRKIRIVLIDGLPYVCHLAISDHWIVHYLSSGMHLSIEKRNEEALFMQNFQSDFAVRYQFQLAAVGRALGLDYVTIDCAELADGTLLIFEVDSRGLVHAQDSIEMYPYKQPIMQLAFDAFASMLDSRIDLATDLNPGF